MARYLLAFTLAIIGGLVGPVTADAIGATGLGAYGLFLAGGAVFVLLATALTVGRGPRQRGHRTASGRSH